MSAALRGVSALELGTYVAAPALGSMLAMMGAEVIKVEPIGGDLTRSATPWSWANYNWNKKSICLNVKSSEGMKILRSLLKMSDIFIEGLSPRAVEDLCIGYARVRKLNPKMIYCSIKGFSSDSSSAKRVGFDTIAQAEGGLMHVTRGEGGRPSRVGNPCVDLTAAAFGIIGILSSLLKNPSRGTFVEIPLYDLVVYWNGYWLPYIDLKGTEPSQLGSSHPGFSPYGIYETSDGFVFIGILSDGQWNKLARKLHLSDKPTFSAGQGRIEGRRAIDEELQGAVRRMRTSEVLDVLGEEVPCARVSTLMEIYSSDELRKRGVLRRVKQGGNRLTIALPPKLQSVFRRTGVRALPSPGLDTRRILGRLGFKEASILQLRKAGVIA